DARSCRCSFAVRCRARGALRQPCGTKLAGLIDRILAPRATRPRANPLPSAAEGSMTENTKASLKDQVTRLERHLAEENPQMLGVVRSYRRLDQVAWRLGLLDRTESYATKIAWWPLISVLGTYSSGKSTFINHVLGFPLQKTGN